MSNLESESVGEQAPEKADKNLKIKPKKILPTERAAVVRQFDIIRAYAAASGPDKRPVSNEDVAKVVNIHFGTISNCNPFFLETGLVSKAKNGNVPCEEVFAYASSSSWGIEKAAQKLAPLIRKTWFYQALSPKLAFRTLTIDQAVEFLADEAGASPEYKDQLIALIEYLKTVGLVSVDGGTVSLVKDVEGADNLGRTPPGAGAGVPPPGVPDPEKGREGRKNPEGNHENHHPFIVGLLKTLPEPEGEWSIAGRVKWLQAASNIFG
jgi:hypothetical protein